MDRTPSRAGVRDTYDRIAPHFAGTRRSAWPEVETFLENRSGDRGLDIGCGNGRHLPILEAVTDEVIGLDLSKELLREVPAEQTHAVHLLLGDAAELPIASNSIDVALYVATLHHLPNRSLRIQSLDEVARILQPHGTCLVSVWSVTDDRFDFEVGRDETISWTLPDGTTVERFYHIFDRESFAAELEDSALGVESLRESSGNWYAVVRGEPVD